jgi:predicted acylesterase/phospholipase RssA/CRP-like cAMP-binding protein
MRQHREEKPTGLVGRITSNELFRGLDQATLEALEEELELVHLPADESLLRQGEPGDALYVLTHGCLSVKVRNPDGTETAVDRLDAGMTVGDMELLTGKECVATVYASGDAELVRFSKAGFDRLAEEHPQVVNSFAQTILPRFHRAQLLGILTALFGELDAEAIHDLQSRMEWVHLRSGAVLVRQGDPGDAMYIIVQGRLRFVVESADGVERATGELGAGETVGEFALLTDDTRTATVYAIRDSEVVRLSRSVFDSLLLEYPHVMTEIARIMSKRRQRSIRVSPTERTAATTIAIVPTGADVPLSEFSQRLAEVLQALGPTLHLSAERFNSAYGKAGACQTCEEHATNVVLVAWLSEREREYRYIIYETDGTWSPWTERCLRQADCILIVGRADSDSALGEIEMAMRGSPVEVRTELVLLQAEDARLPGGTSEWLGKRQVRAHHHVRMRSVRDFKRLARRVTGHALGLVLSGGGARGFGHVGAIRAIEEAGLEVDIVGGTSMGSLAGGLYALGFDWESLYELAESYASREALFDYTIPLVSFFETKKITNLLVGLSRGAHIEDLWLPYFCVSCNLSRGAEVVHRQGLLWESMRASMAIPGVFAPLLQSGDLLVDGGAINNFPIDVMRDICGTGTVIGIDASPADCKLEEYDFGPSISGWQVLRKRLNPFGEPMQVPSVLSILVRTLDVNGMYRTAAIRHLADLVVALPVEEFGILEFESYERIVDIGYTATRRALEEWKPG